ncbi:MAG: HIT family protein [Candidatus Pacebacteria bacterium]|nr:HIT family protein [Candidatus Paceibacterota bacterium]
MDDCIFCKIIKGEIPCYKVYEDEDTLAFLDIRPLNPGHTLVIPKKHFRWVWDIENIGKHYEVVKKIANTLKKVYNTDRVVSLVVGDEVEHAHTWLVPRFEGDGHGDTINSKNIKKISEDEMKKIAEKIQREFN